MYVSNVRRLQTRTGADFTLLLCTQPGESIVSEACHVNRRPSLWCRNVAQGHSTRGAGPRLAEANSTSLLYAGVFRSDTELIKVKHPG